MNVAKENKVVHINNSAIELVAGNVYNDVIAEAYPQFFDIDGKVEDKKPEILTEVSEKLDVVIETVEAVDEVLTEEEVVNEIIEDAIEDIAEKVAVLKSIKKK